MMLNEQPSPKRLRLRRRLVVPVSVGVGFPEVLAKIQLMLSAGPEQHGIASRVCRHHLENPAVPTVMSTPNDVVRTLEIRHRRPLAKA